MALPPGHQSLTAAVSIVGTVKMDVLLWMRLLCAVSWIWIVIKQKKYKYLLQPVCIPISIVPAYRYCNCSVTSMPVTAPYSASGVQAAARAPLPAQEMIITATRTAYGLKTQ